MSDCPHLDSVCDSRHDREKAACPGVKPDELMRLAVEYPAQVNANPVLPMLVLENPKWAALSVDVEYRTARNLWNNSAYGLDTNAMRRFGLEAVEHVWRIRKNSKNERALALLNATRALLDSPLSYAVIGPFAEIRKQAFTYMRSTLKSSTSGMVMRALYHFSGVKPGEHRVALGLLTDAVQLHEQKSKKCDFIGATKLALAEVKWQRARWEEMQVKP